MAMLPVKTPGEALDKNSSAGMNFKVLKRILPNLDKVRICFASYRGRTSRSDNVNDTLQMYSDDMVQSLGSVKLPVCSQNNALMASCWRSG